MSSADSSDWGDSMRDRVVVVTGAGSGIGRAAAVLCARRGAAVGVVDRNAATAATTSEDIEASGGRALALACDVGDEEAVETAFSVCAETFGTPDGVVAAAGVEIGASLSELSLGEWRTTLETNLTGAFLVSRAAIGRARSAGTSAALVLISSPAAFVGFADGGAAAYSASKGGISAFVRAVAVECAGDGIRVNAVVPGATDTALAWAKVPAEEVDATRQRLAAEIPLGRLARPEEAAEAAVWLLSPAASFVTGSHLICDGGTLAKASIGG